MALPPSLHDQHRALRELHDAVGPAADHALVQCRMAFRADDEQIDLELGREPNDVAHGMARDDVGLKLDVMLCAMARARCRTEWKRRAAVPVSSLTSSMKAGM